MRLRWLRRIVEEIRCRWLANKSKLAIATLLTTASVAAFSLSGGEKVDKTQPPINAKSKDEESFVK